MKKISTTHIIIIFVVILLILMVVYFKRGFQRPVPGKITSPFGMRMHPTLHVWKMHEGVDMTGAEGTPIRATKSGKITARRYNDVGGNEIVIDHGHGLTSGYSHLSAFAVQIGDYVRKGQVIGYVGSTGRATGPHLHFSMKRDGKFIDPAKYI